MTDVSARIAALLDEYTLAVNVGHESGVREGDRVTLWSVVKVNDPETKEPLGVVRLPKLALEVTQVQQRLAVARVPSSPLTFAGLNLSTRPAKKLASGQGSSEAVQVNVGEEATVQIRDRKEAGSEP